MWFTGDQVWVTVLGLRLGAPACHSGMEAAGSVSSSARVPLGGRLQAAAELCSCRTPPSSGPVLERPRLGLTEDKRGEMGCAGRLSRVPASPVACWP